MQSKSNPSGAGDGDRDADRNAERELEPDDARLMGADEPIDDPVDDRHFTPTDPEIQKTYPGAYRDSLTGEWMIVGDLCPYCGRSPDELVHYDHAADCPNKVRRRSYSDEPPPTDPAELDESWRRVDLGPALRGEITRPEPTILRRDDGAALYTAGCVNWLHGDSGDGKSMVAAVAVAEELEVGRPAIWIDFEDPDPSTLIERLRDTLDVSADAIAAYLHYYKPAEPFDDRAVAQIARDAVEHGVTLIVIDSFGEAFGLEGLDENKDVDVAPWVRRVPRRLADAGPGVLVLDHSTKAGDNPLYPSGSKRKRAAITGQGYLLEAPSPLTREHGGRLTLKAAKDRHGSYRRGAIVAAVELNIYPDGAVVHVRAPAERERDTDTPSAKLDLMERKAVQAVRDEGAALSQRRLLELMNVKASDRLKKAGIEQAVARGTLRDKPGSRNAILYELPDAPE